MNTIIQRAASLLFLVCLLLSTPAALAQSENCPDALPSRLVIGAIGRVLPGDANNIRASADSSSTRLGQIPAGEQFRVLDGPVCGAGIVWWQIRYRGIIGFTAESVGDSYFVEPVVFEILPGSTGGLFSQLPLPIETSDLTPITAANLDQLEQLGSLGRGRVTELRWSADASQMIVATLGGIWLYDAQDMDAEPRLLTDEASKRIALNPTDNIVANDRGHFFDLSTGEQIEHGLDLPAELKSLAFSADGSRFANAYADPDLTIFVQVWDLASGEKLAEFRQDTGLEGVIEISSDLALNADGSRVFSGDGTGNVWMWPVRPGAGATLIGVVRTRQMAVNSRGTLIAANSDGNLVRLFNSETQALLATFSHAEQIRDIAFSADGSTLATASDDFVIKVWRVSNGALISEVSHDDVVRSVALSPDGSLLLSYGDDGSLRLWETATGTETSRTDAHFGEIRALTFTPGGDLLLGSAGVRNLHFSENGERLLVQRWQSVEVWSVGESYQRLSEHPIGVLTSGHAWLVDPQNLHYTVGDYQGNVNTYAPGEVVPINSWDSRIWLLWGEFTEGGESVWMSTGNAELLHHEMSDGTLIDGWEDLPDNVARFKLMDADSMLALLSNTQLIEIDLQSGDIFDFEPVDEAVLEGVYGGSYSLSLSPDQSLIMATMRGGMIFFWDRESAALLHIVPANNELLHVARWDDEARFIVTTGSDGIVRVWGIASK